MEIREFFSAQDRAHWLEQIGRSDWGAGQYLHSLLSRNELKKLCGETTQVFLLTDGDQLVSFCTYAEQDDISAPGMGPWVGFVYTFPRYRGHRHMGRLLRLAYETAKANGEKQLYISTGETGLYEKYGYSFYKLMKDVHGEDSRVYRIDIA